MLQLAGLVSLGYGIYALAKDDDNNSDFFREDDGVNDKMPEIVLVSASAVVVILTFLGCCGALRVSRHLKCGSTVVMCSTNFYCLLSLQESRFAMFLYFVILLVLSLAAVAGATVAIGRSVSNLQ